MILSDRTIKSMAMGKVFKENTDRINSLDYTRNGKYLVTASDDDSVRLFDAVSGKMRVALNTKKYGVDLVRFTHHEYSVVCASNNGWDQTLRYWSLHDNSYLRYFKGHRDKVTSIAMSPLDDTFLSASLDNTVRLWDLRSNACQGIIRRQGGRPVVSYGSQGLAFGLTCANNEIKMFDSRHIDGGAFLAISVSYDRDFEWSSFKFSPDGTFLLLSTDCEAIFIVDSFQGDLKHIFTRPNPNKEMFEASWSPDSKYVFTGGHDGTIYTWNIETGKQTTVLRGHAGSVLNVQFNPGYCTMASSCKSLALWIPTVEN